MFVLSIKQDTQKPFVCHDALESYICCYCSLTTQQRTHAIEHPCEFEIVHNEGISQRCRKCQVGRFLNLWRYYQKKKCNFIKKTLLKELTDNLGVEENCYILINIKENKFQIGKTWSQCEQYSATSSVNHQGSEQRCKDGLGKHLKERVKTVSEFNREHRKRQRAERNAVNQSNLSLVSLQNKDIAKTSAQFSGQYKAPTATANESLLPENLLKNMADRQKKNNGRVKYAPKSGAQRAREFRARRKALKNAMIHNGRNDVDFGLEQKNSNVKTPAERSKAYRLRLKLRKKMINEQMGASS